MSVSVYLITPPFTQLNTPYPATAYLKGYLNTKGIDSFQSDLGIEVIHAIFNRSGLERVFDLAGSVADHLSEFARQILLQRKRYLQTIGPVMGFMQGLDPTLAHRIAARGFLPEGSRFEQVADLEWAFGSMGVQDRAKHLATLYLEDLSDLIREGVDEHFGFNRYAERLSRSANSFDALQGALDAPLTFTDHVLLGILEARINELQPALLAISVPFPGNLYAGLRCAQWVKANRPQIHVALGGGYANTELRNISDTRVFQYLDFITLDDGEAPIECLWEHIQGKRSLENLKRTLLLQDGKLVFMNDPDVRDIAQKDTGTPDYSGLLLDRYISAIEVLNPMHRLWSDGRWNKLTMAHGCYWGHCTFCDLSLDYIGRYEPLTAALLCDRMEEQMRSTGISGFHFVDEAAPPALMKALAIEILRRGLVVSWWTNIRFEKSFTRDLCQLLKASGCIGVSGGLEVASDRLLQLINKGITVAQVARVTHHFREAGIMVHAYLMYGFPTQTAQETIDSMEMVRQMFQAGVLQSAYWHLFTMTAHSPVGMEPGKFGVVRKPSSGQGFAVNDLEHEDPAGASHEQFGYGLSKSLLNFMHGQMLDQPLQKWFDFQVPKTTVAPDHIIKALQEEDIPALKDADRLLWIGDPPMVSTRERSRKGSRWEETVLIFPHVEGHPEWKLEKEKGLWLGTLLQELSSRPDDAMTGRDIRDHYAAAGLHDFELFWDNKPVNGIYKVGLLKY